MLLTTNATRYDYVFNNEVMIKRLCYFKNATAELDRDLSMLFALNRDKHHSKKYICSKCPTKLKKKYLCSEYLKKN